MHAAEHAQADRYAVGALRHAERRLGYVGLAFLEALHHVRTGAEVLHDHDGAEAASNEVSSRADPSFEHARRSGTAFGLSLLEGLFRDDRLIDFFSSQRAALLRVHPELL